MTPPSSPSRRAIRIARWRSCFTRRVLVFVLQRTCCFRNQGQSFRTDSLDGLGECVVHFGQPVRPVYHQRSSQLLAGRQYSKPAVLGIPRLGNDVPQFVVGH